jgi:hypothetical protein
MHCNKRARLFDHLVGAAHRRVSCLDRRLDRRCILTTGNTANRMANANKAGDARTGLRSPDHGVGT